MSLSGLEDECERRRDHAGTPIECTRRAGTSNQKAGRPWNKVNELISGRYQLASSLAIRAWISGTARRCNTSPKRKRVRAFWLDSLTRLRFVLVGSLVCHSSENRCRGDVKRVWTDSAMTPTRSEGQV